MVRKSKKPPVGAGRTLLQQFVPEKGSVRCRLCHLAVGPGDQHYVSGILGFDDKICVNCLRGLQAMAIREIQAEPSYLEQLRQRVEEDPSLIPDAGKHLTEHQEEASIINRLIIENATEARRIT